MRFKNFMQLASFYVSSNLRVEVSSYYLNFAWWILEPLLMMCVFYVVFEVMLHQGTDNFVGFLLVGLTAWNWFSRSVGNSKNSIHDGRLLIMQVRIPKCFFPFVTNCQDAFKHLFVTALLLVFLCFYTTPVTITWVALPVLMVVQYLLIFAVSLFCSALVPFVPDLRFVITTGIELLFFASGVFYNLDQMVIPEHSFWVYLNPVAGLIKNYRMVLLYGQWPNWGYVANVALFSSVCAAVFLFFLWKYDHVYPKVCQQ